MSSRREGPRTWPEMLAAAPTHEAVMELARDYLARLEPAEIAALPPHCRPPAKFERPDEIVNFAFALVQAHTGANADSEALFRMANFFSYATRRIAELMSQSLTDERAGGHEV